MRTTDLVGINCITRVLLVYTCQQGVYPRGHVLPLRLPHPLYSKCNYTTEAWQETLNRCETSLNVYLLTMYSEAIMCFNPLKPSGNYVYHLFYQTVTLHFVFMGFVWF
jgi:hypothetical protein